MKGDNKSIDLGNKLYENELRPNELLKGQEKAFKHDIDKLKSYINEFIEIPCPACCNDQYVLQFKKFSFSYVTCVKCETLYMNPRPTPQIMKKYYEDSENYRYWAKHIFPASEQSRKEKIHKPRLESILKYCKKYNISQEIILEVGAGFGTFGEVVRESNSFKKYIGIEPTPEMALACKQRGLEIINKPVEEVCGDIGNIDVIVSFEVIEHLFNPYKFINTCCSLLKDGGLLVLSCPNGKGFDVSLLRQESVTVDAEHVNLFNPDSLSSLVNRCGFSIREVTTPGRLDAEFVREAIMNGKSDLGSNAFFKLVLIDEWKKLGWEFQNFISQNGLSSHMWLVAIKGSIFCDSK